MPTITATIEIADRSEKRSPRINTPARTETTVVEVCRTDLEGSIVIFSNGMEVTKKAA